jgi:hypothetical protein
MIALLHCTIPKVFKLDKTNEHKWIVINVRIVPSHIRVDVMT